MGIDTHKVEIVPITLEKHPNADRLSVVRVFNFTVVVGTEDWLGVTKAAYVQPDSVLPDTFEYRFLKDTQSTRKEREQIARDVIANLITPEAGGTRLAVCEAKIDSNTKYLRIAVKRLRGVMSMGMLLPCPEGAEIGDDVAERLGITHYDPPTVEETEGSRRHTGDDVAPAPTMVFSPKYDVENAYRWATECFEHGEPVYVTEKLDGQNGRYVATADAPLLSVAAIHDEVVIGTPLTLHAGSRTEWKKKEGNSNWWRVIEQNPWAERWCMDNQGKVLYGEVFGFVQALRYGAKPGQLFFRAFDIINGTEYLDSEAFTASLPEEHRAPCLGVMPFDFEALQKLADGPSLVPGASNEREGIVIKPIKERRHWKLGRVMVKMVGLKYLEKQAR
jgi:RNA ligase (TIGR02306 family)